MAKMLGRVSLRVLIGVFIAAGGFAAMKAYDQSQKRQQAQLKQEAPSPASTGSLLDAYQSDFDKQANDLAQRPQKP
ncbi:hypothetical protein [Comamonas sp. F1-6]|uniref:hypothetical protein n=1 Tax=Comamonas sp. F1-6 TaxID=673550 RepID=UPI0031E22A47